MKHPIGKVYMTGWMISWVAILSSALVVLAQTKELYQNDFEKAEAGKVPADFLVLDGGVVVKEGEWKIEGKAWTQGAQEPPDWMIAFDEKETPVPGRASVFGSPFSGAAIQFDDFVVSGIKRKE